ncbi:MAG: hypothetical protein M1812_000961 [Candelaria pacifica]|nr:MAG: hypothetical protein M1812_000961 [Candelaria pacifica]
MANQPSKQIRALYDDDIVTVYQAYSSTIASAAVKEQKLSASPAFKLDRMSWIKPSWCWMMYRCGYSYKDTRQECVLALRMKHEHFQKLLAGATLAQNVTPSTHRDSARVQWDPERGPRLERLEDVRSIQIGIPAALMKVWVDEWIESIEDVTEKARSMRSMLDSDTDVTSEELIFRGLLPREREYAIPTELAQHLGMV